MRAEYLSKPPFFLKRSRFRELVFAEIPVGLDRAHRVMFDTAQKLLYCTCPFHPKPCVHAQALALLYAEVGEAEFEPLAEMPAWVSRLSAGQTTRGSILSNGAQREKDRLQRRFERLDRAADGFDDLESWLDDVLRRGLATGVSEDPALFRSISARLADASMGGLSRMFRLMAEVPIDEPDWPEQAMATLAAAALSLSAFRRRVQLPEQLIHDLEAFIGLSRKKEEVLAQGERVRDVWTVLAVMEEPLEAQLRMRRSWLLGSESGRFALILDYMHGSMDFLPGLRPGTTHRGELAFYTSPVPQRALVVDTLEPAGTSIRKLPGFDQISELMRGYAAAIGRQPWLGYFPAVLQQVRPFRQNDRFGIADTLGHALPLAVEASAGWSLIALSRGEPLTLFGEWSGNVFRVLSAIGKDGRFVAL